MNSGCFPKGTYQEAKRLLGWYERGVISWGEMLLALAGNQQMNWDNAASAVFAVQSGL